ncbi:helix-turn-helix domain-containing protein [Haladaptatus sp. NG-SE-30]
MAHGASDPDGSPDESEDSSGVTGNPALSAPPRTLFAEIFVTHETLVLVPTIESVPELTIQMEGTPTVDSSSLFVSVVGDDFTAFERATEMDSTVSGMTLFSASADHRVSQIRPSPLVTAFLPTAAELGVRILDVKSGSGGWIARIQMLSREPLIQLRNDCLDAGITFRVRQLYDADPDSEIEGTRLTARQRDTVLTAFQSGYYDVPRGISQGELAEKLGVSTSAISQQLRRATGQLIASTFAVDRD